MDQLHLNVRNTASSVELDKQGRERDLGRGFRSKSYSLPKCRKIRKLRILQCNINGLCTSSSRVKLDKILELASKHHVPIIALQETKLHKRHRLRVKGYNIVRQDRSSNGGGGLMSLIRDVNFQGIDRITSRGKPKTRQNTTTGENTNSIIGINGTPAVNDKEAADALGNNYSEERKLALGRENKKTGRATRKLIRSCRVPASNELFNDPITSSELLYAIQQLNFKKSAGPDGIHGEFIVNLGSCATKRLLHIFNLSWKLGRLPRQWKTAIVVPIRKPNKDAGSMGSYRPIALTCTTCKLMERIILRRITFHLMNRNMLPQEQYGFRKDIVQSTKYSTLSNGAARIITGLRHSCPNDIACYEADLQTPLLEKRNKYGEDSPLGLIWKQGLTDIEAEPSVPFNLLTPTTVFSNVTFNEDLKVKFIKHEEHPELLRQLALEIINNISPRPWLFTLMEANLTMEEQVAEFL
ncbi:RNA-directed DNA polymerase from mobile element jockey [Caerostris extrusa]|uniref:RNA-directed DNA polymerase from mobile element jockey n=1 Tax=Caerostris extrusa TaxID=172846 RepID=A0AAV4WTN0_CAEEX|nr:RNA-directed DNA polymerase from mobile element jockey [Caerostris extrusa]